MNPGPWRITFDTNPDDCNLKCLMCEEHSPFSAKQAQRLACGEGPRRMDITVMEKVLEELRDSPPRELIPSTMGEPLLYQDFDRILELCSRHGIKLNLTTNGTFPRRGVRRWAGQILPVGSDIKVSLNGTRAEIQERVMLNTRLESVMENLRTLASMRDELAESGGNYCSLTLQVTFMEMNLAQIPDLVRLAAGLNFDRIKGHHLWVHFAEMRDQDLRRSPDSIERWNRVAADCHALAKVETRPGGRAVRLENFNQLALQDTRADATASECPFLGREAWVNHAGRFDPCCAPDELRKTLGNFGQVQEGGLRSIWNGKPYRDLMGNYRNHPLCQNCLMRRPPP